MGAAQFKNRQCKNLRGVTHTTLRFKRRQEKQLFIKFQLMKTV